MEAGRAGGIRIGRKEHKPRKNVANGMIKLRAHQQELFPLCRPSTGVNARTVLAGKGSLRRAGARPCPLRSGSGDSDLRRAAPPGTAPTLHIQWRRAQQTTMKKLLTRVGLLMEVLPEEPFTPDRTFLSRLNWAGSAAPLIRAANIYGNIRSVIVNSSDANDERVIKASNGGRVSVRSYCCVFMTTLHLFLRRADPTAVVSGGRHSPLPDEWA